MRFMGTWIFMLATLVVTAPLPAQTAGATAKPKEKEKILQLLDDAEALGRWMPNEPSFMAVLGKVHDQLAAADESEFTPLREFDPHFSHLEATLARMRDRMDSVQAATELCDPARRSDLFLLFLDTLDAEGHRKVNARICEKLASLDESSESLAQVCVGSNLAFLAARSMHDLVLVCDPTIDRTSNASAEGLDQLRSELAGMSAGVQESVRNARRDLTQAMTVVAGHVSEVTLANTSSLQGTIREGQDHALRLEIEKALESGKSYGALYLPQANGGQLETVRNIVATTIENVLSSGETQNGATSKLAAGDDEYKKGHYKKAFRLYSDAYAAAIAAGDR
jgi:hypothetical protein